MSKKDYEAAATLIQDEPDDLREHVIETFCEFFRNDNGRFEERRFRRACVPGANVRSRRAA
jgi:hypothetical protein